MKNQLALLNLLRLSSPALPVGAYSYSQGLENAAEQNWVHDEESARQWIMGILTDSLAKLDLPIGALCFQALQTKNYSALNHWNAYLQASRESAELQLEDQQMGAALIKLLTQLDFAIATQLSELPHCSFIIAYMAACEERNIDLDESLLGFTWSWSENQVAAACKIIPLGQTAAQRINESMLTIIPSQIELAHTIAATISQMGPEFYCDTELISHSGFELSNQFVLGNTLPGLGIASMAHETQYSRLFRS